MHCVWESSTGFYLFVFVLFMQETKEILFDDFASCSLIRVFFSKKGDLICWLNFDIHGLVKELLLACIRGPNFILFYPGITARAQKQGTRCWNSISECCRICFCG